MKAITAADNDTDENVDWEVSCWCDNLWDELDRANSEKEKKDDAENLDWELSDWGVWDELDKMNSESERLSD
jgi:hypothetical protein